MLSMRLSLFEGTSDCTWKLQAPYNRTCPARGWKRGVLHFQDISHNLLKWSIIVHSGFHTVRTLSSISHLQHQPVRLKPAWTWTLTVVSIQESPSMFLLWPPHAGLLRVFVLLFILFFIFLSVYGYWCNRQPPRPPDSQLLYASVYALSAAPLLCQNTPRALGEMHVLITVSFP